MVQRNGYLDQPLIEFSRRSLRVGPKFLPNFMTLEELTIVKIPNPL